MAENKTKKCYEGIFFFKLPMDPQLLTDLVLCVLPFQEILIPFGDKYSSYSDFASGFGLSDNRFPKQASSVFV